MEIPTIVLPDIKKIETIEIPIPTADVPYYKPMVVPPSDLRDQEDEPVKTVEEKPVDQNIVDEVSEDTLCPTCKNNLVFVEGCSICIECGFSGCTSG